MELAHIRDYLKTANIADHYYIGKLDSKKDKSIGVYQLKKRNDYESAIGGKENSTIGKKCVSVLVHWNKNAAETERAAKALYDFLENTPPKTIIGTKEISYIQLLHNEPIAVATDEAGIYERVIEFIVYYQN